VTWDEIKPDIESLHQYDWGHATGYNANSSEKRAQFYGMSMAEYMRWLWNNPQAGQSPYKMFEGVMQPDGKDANGNIIGMFTPRTHEIISETTAYKMIHMLRAVMEGVAYSLRDCIEVFREMNINVNDMMACGGGGSSPLWRSMLADLYNCDVKTSSSKEGPALGVAILASVGAGIYSSVPEACKEIVKTDRIQKPAPENVPEYEKYYQLYREIYPALKKQFAELAKI
jgi:sugar (pentulose or hexulose) kinase